MEMCDLGHVTASVLCFSHSQKEDESVFAVDLLVLQRIQCEPARGPQEGSLRVHHPTPGVITVLSL